MRRQCGAVLDEQRTCVSQCAADNHGSGNAWCKARYIFKAFPAPAVSAKNMIYIFYTSKRPSVNAGTSVEEGESDPMPRTSLGTLPSHCHVSDEEHYTTPRGAEEGTLLRTWSHTPISDSTS